MMPGHVPRRPRIKYPSHELEVVQLFNGLWAVRNKGNNQYHNLDTSNFTLQSKTEPGFLQNCTRSGKRDVERYLKSIMTLYLEPVKVFQVCPKGNVITPEEIVKQKQVLVEKNEDQKQAKKVDGIFKQLRG